MNIILKAVSLILQFEIIFALWKSPEPERFRIYLDEHQSLIIPKRHSEVKILSPVIYDDNFYASLPNINKKPLKYAKYAPAFVKFSPGLELADYGDGKKCCGNKWTLGGAEASLEELVRPVSLPAYQLPNAQYLIFEDAIPVTEDVKPVTEHIEGDLKYDFRTKTHSLR